MLKRVISAIIAAAALAASIQAHGDDSHFLNTQEVTVKVTKVSGNVYMLQGRGGNIGAIVGPEGILIIDDDYKAVTEKLRDALKQLGSASPKFIFNTHWHGDHTEGNFAFGSESTIVAHTNVRKRMMAPPVIFGQNTPAYDAAALPVITYDQSLSIHFAGDEVRAVHYPSGHTDGDTVVFFQKANVVHMGDDFFVGKFPFVDIDSGGSVQGLINNVNLLLKQIPADAKIIPGHGPLATIDDLRVFRDMLVDTSKIVQEAMKKKTSLADIKKAGFPAKYADYGTGFVKPDFWIDILYRSYSKK